MRLLNRVNTWSQSWYRQRIKENFPLIQYRPSNWSFQINTLLAPTKGIQTDWGKVPASKSPECAWNWKPENSMLIPNWALVPGHWWRIFSLSFLSLDIQSMLQMWIFQIKHSSLIQGSAEGRSKLDIENHFCFSKYDVIVYFTHGTKILLMYPKIHPMYN